MSVESTGVVVPFAVFVERQERLRRGFRRGDRRLKRTDAAAGSAPRAGGRRSTSIKPPQPSRAAGSLPRARESLQVTSCAVG
jgi:hypothetical protein